MKIQNWHRRHAVMLASQLPEETEDAMAVLECTRELLANFLQAGAPEPVKAPVVRLVQRDTTTDNSPRVA